LSVEAPATGDTILIVPGDLDQPTGGYRYDASIVAALRALGWCVDVAGLAGRFPDADRTAHDALDRALDGRPDGSIAIIDGLALGGLPEVAARHADRLLLVALVHHPLADETGLGDSARARFDRLEREALAACRRVLTTSRFTARRVARMGIPGERIGTVEPGVEAAEPAGDPARAAERRRQRLLCVGSLTPRKGQDVLIDALATLADADWRLELVGDPARSPEFAAQLERRIADLEWADRVRLRGACTTEELDRIYRNADLVIVPSHYEGYGMVVTEALARGLPLIATTGGALADTVPEQGAWRVPPGDPAALAAALRRWLDKPEQRIELARGALAERDRLSGWREAGRRFAAELTQVAAPA
jgi:glycosyltransferase involved in cell wall biosynthesis